MDKNSRRSFIRNTALTTAGAALTSKSNILFAKNKTEEKRVRVGMIGVGLRGQNHLSLLLNRADTDIVALCDVDSRMMDSAQKLVSKSGKKMPQIILGDDQSYKKLLAIKDLDAIIIATPWEWHCPMIVDAIDAGIKYIGTEVILGITLEDHWNVVNAAEKSGAHVSMLENVCYRRDVMAVLNMVRQGLFGEILHLQGGYQHDLRGVKFNDGATPYGDGAEFGPKGFSEARWRTNHSVHRNGDLYPTHGVGPVSMMIDINRGNRFLSLSSFATKTRGLHNYIVKKGGENHPNAKVRFALGDIVTTHIKCANGETILLQHDTNNPRPYSLGFRVQGTEGLWMDVNHSIYIEGKSKNNDAWDDQKEWFAQYDHPLWKKYANDAKGAGHGGMDFFVDNGFIEAAKRGVATPLDVYDAAAWSAITPLSETSIEIGNQTVDFPDFTSGKWMSRTNTFALDDSY
ncbi:MAG: Gfo/Idh/MocA family oxidoreductase [Chitinophagaceae bacterium]